MWSTYEAPRHLLVAVFSVRGGGGMLYLSIERE